MLDKHAPPVTKQVTDRSQSPLFTEECKRLKTSKRLAEKRYQKHKLTVNLDLWRKALQDYKLCCTKAKSTYYQQKIAENSGNQKELFKVVNTLLHKKKDNRLPIFTDLSALANKFLEFFQTKIDNIRKSFSTVNTSQTPTTRNVSQLQQLSEVTCEEVLKFIQETNNKCCHLDPIPTTLLKSIVDCILPSLTRMVNASIRSSTFPTEWKTATVTPLIKKPDSDPEDMKNFRPVYSVTNNGFHSEFFNISRGIRQGCPNSALLFILCVEVLATYIREQENIKGIMIGNNEIRITQFADDTCIYLNGTNSLENVIAVFEDFYRYAGLRLNIEKTEPIWLGETNRFLKICNIKITHKPIKVLGIWISKDFDEMLKINFDERIEKLNTLLNIWSQRNLTIKGRITILEAKALPLVTYMSTCLYVPKLIIDTIDKALYNFV